MEQITVQHLKDLDAVNKTLSDILEEHQEKGHVCFNVHIEEIGTEYELNIGFFM
ncbi:hypothetical protein Q7V72_03335 [Streptococcus suis]|nr:hypothetical protein [Streptococcus suis]